MSQEFDPGGAMMRQSGPPFPERIFLDSSALQTIHTYGGFIWDGEELSPQDRIFVVPGGYDELEALRSIFIVNERALFEFALSRNSFAEIAARGNAPYLRWAYDVLDHWEASLAGDGAHAFTGMGHMMADRLDGSSYNYLSSKDRLLIRDAIELECDAFLTMERRLPCNASHLWQKLGLQVIRPTEFWILLRPWAALFT